MPEFSRLYCATGDQPVILDCYNTNNWTGASCYKMNGKRNIAVSSGKSWYTGEICSENMLTQTLLAIKKKNQKKWVLVGVKKARLERAKCIPTTKPTTLSSRDINQENRRQLNKVFGTKKVKRMVEVRERMKMDIETVKDKLQATINDISITNNEAELQHSETLKEVYNSIVPYNVKAETVDEIYNLDDFITETEFSELKKRAKTVLKSKFSDIKACDYIKEEIGKLQSDSCPHNKKMKIKLVSMLLYAQDLCVFLSLPVIQLKRFKTESVMITDKIIRQFSMKNINGTINRPLSMKDKLVCHILVLFLLAADRHLIDIEHISSSIRIPITKLAKLAVAVGAQMSKKNITVKTLFELRVPLAELKIGASPRKRSYKK